MTNSKIKFKPISQKVRAIVNEHGGQSKDVLEILVALQTENGALMRETLDEVARSLEIPPAKVYGVASFYSMLEVAQAVPASTTSKIRVCDGPVCWLCDGDIKSVGDSVRKTHPDSKVERTSCLGLCDRAPAALVGDEQVGPIQAEKINDISVDEIRKPVDYKVPRPGEVRVMLANAGIIDPDSLESALSMGAYEGLQAALKLSPEDVIDVVEQSNLNGRGGAGFPVGRKWRYVASASRIPKFVICNADESEPLIFKDRVLIETNPQQILEGMAIAGYATGANTGFIYIRGEYSNQAQRLERGIEQAEKKGWLGDNIAGSGFSFRVHVHRGAGAYICGEETALIESLEGKRGEPRVRPPYPPTSGYLNLPTLVNNVESFAAVPSILQRGAAWYKNLSNNPAGGTKLYMVLGHVNHPGLFEAPFGLTLRQIMDDFGGGLRTGSKFHFALCGGAAGTIVDKSLLDTPIDYTSAEKGISLGAGAFLVCDERVSPVAMLRELMHFFSVESCGKCTPCRGGTTRSYKLLTRIADGHGENGDIQELVTLAEVMQAASFCGLGQSVNLPVKSALAHFGEIFEAGIMRS
ncbi:MAG TPA: NADH-ubiquinone oxidoreductase-F iron-sulfur binding region domain-containing protein [Anaerolineales bacterium]